MRYQVITITTNKNNDNVNSYAVSHGKSAKKVLRDFEELMSMLGHETMWLNQWTVYCEAVGVTILAVKEADLNLTQTHSWTKEDLEWALEQVQH